MTFGIFPSDLSASRPARVPALDRVFAHARSRWDAVALMILAAVVYQPWVSPYLPLADFAVFLVQRGASHTLWGQYAGIASYYIGQGHLQLIEYLEMTVGSALFGVSAQGWHWMYFALMLAVLLVARDLILKTGATRVATFAALALFATMAPVAEAWIMPAGETIALLFVVCALRLALNYCDSDEWQKRAWQIAACAIGVVFSRELIVALMPAVWLLSRLGLRDGKWSWARWTARDTFLISILAVAIAASIIPVAYVWFHFGSAYTPSPYGRALNWNITVERLELVLIPATPRLRRLINLLVDPGFTLLLTLPSLLWIRLLVGGVASRPRRQILWPLAVSGLLIVPGLLAYFPVPIRAGFLVVPMAFGTMFGAAQVFTVLLRKGKSAVFGTLAVLGILTAATSVEARTVLYQHQQRAHLNAALIDKIAGFGGADFLVSATPRPATVKDSWASQLKGLASVSTGVNIGKAADLSCDEAKKILATQPRVIVISAPIGCGHLGNDTYVSATVPEWQWPAIWQHLNIEGRMYVARSAVR